MPIPILSMSASRSHVMPPRVRSIHSGATVFPSGVRSSQPASAAQAFGSTVRMSPTCSVIRSPMSHAPAPTIATSKHDGRGDGEPWA